MFTALKAVAIAYVAGLIKLEILRDFQVQISYNSHRLKEAFGDHPFFELDNRIEGAYGNFFFDHLVKWEESDFREEVMKATGYMSNNVIVSMEPQ